MPQPYANAQYTVFKTGTKSNSTHWQFTALCKGCSSWTTDTGAARYLNPRGGNRLALVYSPSRPSGSSPSSTIGLHETFNYWTADFSQGVNANFQATVDRLAAQ